MSEVRHEAWIEPGWPCVHCGRMAKLVKVVPSLIAEGMAARYYCPPPCDTHFQVAAEYNKNAA